MSVIRLVANPKLFCREYDLVTSETKVMVCGTGKLKKNKCFRDY
jgi:hypothetical protein